MGALHVGHRALIDRARLESDRVVVSIFVNPMQFESREDFDRYPTTLDADLEMCRDAGVDLVYVPTASTMYPEGFTSRVSVGPLGTVLEGRSRPGHFDGVATVVLKLLNAVQPDVAYFGRKDYQQTLVVGRMVVDLDLDVELCVVPTVREPDGLALSSRNARLSPTGRARALAIVRAISEVLRAFDDGEREPSALVATAHHELAAEGLDVDYVMIADPVDLSPAESVEPGHVLLIAAHVDGVRLIDNGILGE